jgi:UPF0176 protein
MTSAAAINGSETAEQSPIINLSCYKFVRLENLQELRDLIRRRAADLNLKGTVLLSSEGINFFVAGVRDSIDSFVEFLRSQDPFADIQPKESINDYKPFNRMLVKIKKEIISFGVPSVDPIHRTSPKLRAAELKQWLDEGKKVHLLDVRNGYEYELGTFDNAIRMNLDHFREFPDAVGRLPEEMREEPVVMFCTGGIRCEKAGPYMEQAGFRHVYQLDGGILKYFEEVGGAHYHGECFVFDQRVGVDPSLKETPTTQCYICQEVVTPEDQKSPHYVPGRSCPACYRDDQQRLVETLEKRQRQLSELTKVLPGSQPYFNRRPLNVPERYDNWKLLDFLADWHPQVGRDLWHQRIEQSLVVPSSLHGRRLRRRKAPIETVPLSPERTVRAGERFDHLQPGTVEPDVNAEIRFLYEDANLIVLEKPAPLPMHASGRFNRNTLRYLINQIYYPERPHMIHRLDANTSGILLLCRRQWVARQIQKQFENRSVEKVYLAKVHGHPDRDVFSCQQPIESEPGEDGFRGIAAGGQGDEAHTDFEVVSRQPDGTTLLRAYPRTGRTNQIRIHLWSLRHPIVGDPAWLPDGRKGTNSALLPEDSIMCLHAHSLSFRDNGGTERTFETSAPIWWGTEEITN